MITAGESVNQLFSMLVHSSKQIAGDSGVQNAMFCISQNIDKKLLIHGFKIASSLRSSQ